MRMSDFSEFAGAAIPWIAMGLLIAVFCVSAANRKKTREKAINDNRKQQGSSQTAKRKGSSSQTTDCANPPIDYLQIYRLAL